MCHAEVVALRTSGFLYLRPAPLPKVMIKEERTGERSRLTSEIPSGLPEKDVAKACS